MYMSACVHIYIYVYTCVCVHSDIDYFSQESRTTKDKEKNLGVFWLHQKTFCLDLSSSIIQDCNSSIVFDFPVFSRFPLYTPSSVPKFTYIYSPLLYPLSISHNIKLLISLSFSITYRRITES